MIKIARIISLTVFTAALPLSGSGLVANCVHCDQQATAMVGCHAETADHQQLRAECCCDALACAEDSTAPRERAAGYVTSTLNTVLAVPVSRPIEPTREARALRHPRVPPAPDVPALPLFALNNAYLI